MKYEVEIREVNYKVVSIEADSPQSAKAKAWDLEETLDSFDYEDFYHEVVLVNEPKESEEGISVVIIDSCDDDITAIVTVKSEDDIASVKEAINNTHQYSDYDSDDLYAEICDFLGDHLISYQTSFGGDYELYW